MTTTHLVGYLLLGLSILLFVFAAFAETVTGLTPWVRRLRRTQEDWRSLRLDLAQVADSAGTQPQTTVGSRLEQLCVLPANRVFMHDELGSLAKRYHGISVRETWKILGATSFPGERVYEVANHLRIYVILFLLLIGLNIFSLIPESADVAAHLSGPIKEAVHNFAGFLGKNIGQIVAVKEALIVGFFTARMYGERSVFLNFAKE